MCSPVILLAQEITLESKLIIADSLFSTRDFIKTGIYLDQLIESARDSGSIDIESRAIYVQAKIKHDTYYHKEAIDLYQDFRRCREESQMPYDTFLYHRNIAVCYAAISKPHIALNHFDTAYAHLDINNNIEAGNYFGGLAYFFGNNNHDSLALELTKKALSYFKDEGLRAKIMWYQYDLAFYSDKLGQYQESIQYLDTVIDLAAQLKDSMGLWMGLACKGINEIKLERYESGIDYMELAAELEDIFDQKLCCANEVYRALGYGKLGLLDNMKTPLDKALGQISEIVDRHDRSEVYEALSEVYTILEDDKEALKYYKLYRQLDDSIADKSYSTQIALQEVKLEHHKLLDQIKHADKSYREQEVKYSLTKKIMIASILGLIIFFGLYINNYRKLQSYKYDYQLWKLAFENSSQSNGSENPHSKDAKWLQKAKLHVVDHLNDETFKVSDLAKFLDLTPRDLNTRLNGILQMTANKFIKTIRIEHAKELLRSESKTISEIAYDVGFSDSAYFSRVFKAATGSTPKAWRSSYSV